MAEARATAAGAPDPVDQSPSAVPDLSTFVVQQVLSEDAREKRVAMLGRFEGKDGAAVLLLARRHFELSNVQQTVQALSAQQLVFCNDIYYKYAGTPEASASVVTVDVIHPATEKHIRKHTAQKRHMVVETPQLYSQVVLPYISSLPTSRLQWVYNILEKKAEADRLIFEAPGEETGFMVHPDLKFDGVQVEQLYCIVLCHRRDIRSIRDLREQHLPLLRAIAALVPQELQQRYGVERDQLRLWCHYQPSYYHFHVHVAHIAWEGPGVMAGKAILLQDIIDHLELWGSTYYERATLTYSLGEDDELWGAINKQA